MEKIIRVNCYKERGAYEIEFFGKFNITLRDSFRFGISNKKLFCALYLGYISFAIWKWKSEWDKPFSNNKFELTEERKNEINKYGVCSSPQ
jgi:hypothetical protein